MFLPEEVAPYASMSCSTRFAPSSRRRFASARTTSTKVSTPVNRHRAYLYMSRHNLSVLDSNYCPVQTQVNEMQLVREKVYAMEQTHMALKQKYAGLPDPTATAGNR